MADQVLPDPLATLLLPSFPTSLCMWYLQSQSCPPSLYPSSCCSLFWIPLPTLLFDAGNYSSFRPSSHVPPPPPKPFPPGTQAVSFLQSRMNRVWLAESKFYLGLVILEAWRASLHGMDLHLVKCTLLIWLLGPRVPSRSTSGSACSCEIISPLNPPL